MSHLKISVCVPTYNHENYIRDCIASIILQDVAADIEILVGDDHSTDQTSQIIEELACRHSGRIRHIRREKNIGPFENLRLLVHEAQGDFIAHLDGDDYWQPGKLKAQLNFLLDSQDCIACYTNAWVVYDDLSPLGIFNNKMQCKFDLKFLLKQGNFLSHSSILYRAEHKDCVLDCPESFIDYRIHIGLAMRGMLGYLNAPYVTYRHASSQSMVKRSNQKVRILYLEALLYAFDNNDLDDVYEEAMVDFVARIVKDGASMGSVSLFIFWLDKLRKDIKKTRNKIFLFGILRGSGRVLFAVFRKICARLTMADEMRVVNER